MRMERISRFAPNDTEPLGKQPFHAQPRPEHAERAFFKSSFENRAALPDWDASPVPIIPHAPEDFHSQPLFPAFYHK